MENKKILEAFEVLKKIKEEARKTARDQLITEDGIREAIKVCRRYYDQYEYLSNNSLISEELIDLSGDIYALENRLE